MYVLYLLQAVRNGDWKGMVLFSLCTCIYVLYIGPFDIMYMYANMLLSNAKKLMEPPVGRGELAMGFLVHVLLTQNCTLVTQFSMLLHDMKQ